MRARSLLSWERRDPDADVLIVTNGYPTERDPTYCPFMKREVDTLVDKGVHCDVLFIHGYASSRAYLAAALRFLRWNVTGAPRRYRIVHVHGGEAALAAGFYRRAPLLVSYWGDDILGTYDADGRISLGLRIKRALIRLHSRSAGGTITMTEQMEQALPRKQRDGNVVVPDGVDPDQFRPLDQGTCRQQLGWSADELVALFVANPAVPNKRFWLAEAAADRAREAIPNLRLRVAAGLRPEEIPVHMNAADCLILTSASEGSPNVVKEALMCNLPVVTTDVGDVRRRLAGVEPAAVCAATPEALGDALAEILRSPARSNGRDQAMSVATHTVYQQIVDVYERMTNGAVAATQAPEFA